MALDPKSAFERLREQYRAAGVDVEFKIWPGMWHVFQSGAATMPEARQSLAEISRFVSKQLRAGVPV